MLRVQTTHEITAQTEYITALLLAPVHRLPQRNDAIRGGISAFHYHMQICQEVLKKKGATASNWGTCYESIRQVIGGRTDLLTVKEKSSGARLSLCK